MLDSSHGDVNTDDLFAGGLDLRHPEGRTELSNARRFVRQHGQQLRYCRPWNEWMIWDGRRWRPDDSGERFQLAGLSADLIWRQARESSDPERMKFATRSASHRGIQATLSLAAAEPGVPIQPDEFDRDPWLLNCPNGTVDLRTGDLRPHNRDDLLTKVTAAEFDPDADSDDWNRFLETTFAGDAGMIDYVGRLIGYCLTGVIREHVLPVCHGPGANGKTVLIESITNAVGPDYCGKAPRDLLLSKATQHPTELADLHGKRLIVSAETGDGRRLDEPLVKELTGGDTIAARRMRQDFWRFQPTHKLILCTNHRPAVRGTDHGIWRRLRLVPFTQTFEGERQDRTLPERLKAQGASILAWAVRGCLEWQRFGLAEPDAIQIATTEYRTAEDIIGQFIAERCTVDPAATIRFATLTTELETWTAQTGQPDVPVRRLSRELTQRGFDKYTNNGLRFRGLRLQSEPNGTTEQRNENPD